MFWCVIKHNYIVYYVSVHCKLLQTTHRNKFKNICKFITIVNSLAGLPG
jgi:hypothetical protein